MATSVQNANTVAPNAFTPEQVLSVTRALNSLLADVFALYIKTKNFHWHMSGPHFRDYHLLLDEHADQIFAISDDIAERVRKVGGETLKSIGQISKLQRIHDNEKQHVAAKDMLRELQEDNQTFVVNLREAHEIASEANDFATTSLIENWIDQAERRSWFLYQATR